MDSNHRYLIYSLQTVSRGGISKADFSKLVKEVTSLKSLLATKKKPTLKPTKTKKGPWSTGDVLAQALSNRNDNAKYNIIQWIRENYSRQIANQIAKEIGLNPGFKPTSSRTTVAATRKAPVDKTAASKTPEKVPAKDSVSKKLKTSTKKSVAKVDNPQ